MAGHARVNHWIALMLLGIQISILGLAVGSLPVVLLGAGVTVVVYLANVLERYDV